MNPIHHDHETMAGILERTADYRVLRRVPSPSIGPLPAGDEGAGLVTAIVLDTETTGLDHDTDAVIELAMARVAFDPRTSTVSHISGIFSGLHDPGRPLPPEIVRLTGLTDTDLAGHRIDPIEVERFLAGAVLAIAHNSAFDRPFAERAWPAFAGMPWGCSLSQVDWAGEGVEGARLTQILAAAGLFHRGHRAIDDTLALTHLLGLPLRSGSTPLRTILEKAAAPGVRIWAAGAPFAAKDRLRARGYRWSDGRGGAPRAWHAEVPEPAADAEVAWLQEAVYRDPAAEPLRVAISAVDRFSSRAMRVGADGPKVVPAVAPH